MIVASIALALVLLLYLLIGVGGYLLYRLLKPMLSMSMITPMRSSPLRAYNPFRDEEMSEQAHRVMTALQGKPKPD